MNAHRFLRRATLVIALGVLSALVPLAAGGAAAQAVPRKDAGNISARLAELAATAGVTTSDAGENRAAGLPSSGAGSLLHRPDGTFLVNARLASVDSRTEAALERTGARVTARSVPDHLVTLALAPGQIELVSAVPGVEWVEEVLTPTIHRADRTDLAGLEAELRGDGVTTSAACSARVISEADTHNGAAAARTTYGVDGTGIKIGVLSDSYDNEGGAATDIANGELPGAGNPCGRTTPVVVQSDYASGRTDEGRGMAQAVHDVAPGAQIMVATAFNGDVDFANQIRNLAAAGARVIVDDISYFNEPMYQDGIIAKAIADVTAAGVTYFSSAANSNIILGGLNVASYEAPSYRPTTCPGTITATYGDADCHDWNPGAGTDGGNLLTVGNTGQLQIKLGYSEPQYGISTDLDLFLLDNSTNAVVAAASLDNKVTTKQAYELLAYTNNSGSTKTYRLVVGRYSSAATPRFKVIMQRASGLTSVQWNASSGGDLVGPTSYGHNMMRNAGSIAAIRYDNTTAPEAFSSRGPATYCWNPVVGTTAATALPSCVDDTVDIAATDGAANSFFGQLVSGVWRFFGTSQAAPHAAAVATLQLQAQPCRTPAQILAAQRSSGTAIGSFGVDAVGGGRLNASGAISALAACPTAPGAPTGVTGTPGNTQVSLSWTAPAANGGSAISGYTVTPFIGATAQTPVAFASAATAQTITGLANGTAYTFKVKATNAAGTGADSAASAAVTPRAVPGAPTAVTATAGNAQVALTWSAPASNGGSAITGYRVTPSIGATAQTPVVFASTATSQTITGLANGTAYTFVVEAVNAAGTGAPSAASPAITPRTVPGAPTAVTGTAGDTQVALSWTAPSSNGGAAITAYTITPFIGATAQTPVAFASAATTQTITGLTNGTAYTFKVKATNAAGTGADSATSAAVTPRTLPSAPTAVTGTPGNGQVALSWTAPSSDGGQPITGYVVTPSVGGTAQAPIAFGTTATTQTITGLANGTAYTFVVEAVNAAGTGAPSAASPAITPRTVPGAPTAVTGTAGDGQVALSWTAPSSNGGAAITAYTVTPFIGATAQTPVAFASAATSQTITGLANGTAYTFKVKATNAAGTGADSAASAAVTPAPDSDPWAPFASWSAMVDRFYLDMLGRPPTSSERSARIAQLTAGTLTPGGLVAALRLDTDNVNNVDPVTRLYRAYFLRIPDKGGLTYWIRQRRVNGKKLNTISDSFATSSEFKTKYGSLSNRAFVELVYENVLGREGETSGVNYWTSRLDRKVNTRGQVMTGFSESNEYKTKQVSEVHVSVIHILLGGVAPSASVFATQVAALDAESTTPAEIAQAIIDSEAYATRIGG